jgi:DNA ligase-1
LHNASGNESLFLLRTVLETLRVGVADGTLRDAIAWAFLETKSGYDAEKNDITLDDTSREAYNAVVEQVQRAYDRCNDFAQVAVAAKTEGLARVRGNPSRTGYADQSDAGPARTRCCEWNGNASAPLQHWR